MSLCQTYDVPEYVLPNFFQQIKKNGEVLVGIIVVSPPCIHSMAVAYAYAYIFKISSQLIT